jgi:CRP-like cAMP-binding protein
MLDEPAAARIRQLGQPRTFVTGDVLVAEGTESDELLLIISGRAKILTPSPSGREAMLGVRGPGDLIGDVSAIDGRPRSASVIALERVTAAAVATSQFVSLLEAEPAVALSLLRSLAHRLRDADDKRRQHAGLDATARVASRLVELAEMGEVVPLTQEDLSGWTGASLEATAKALRTLRDAGVIVTGRKRIEVVDLAGLTRWAAG